MFFKTWNIALGLKQGRDQSDYRNCVKDRYLKESLQDHRNPQEGVDSG